MVDDTLRLVQLAHFGQGDGSAAGGGGSALPVGGTGPAGNQLRQLSGAQQRGEVDVQFDAARR